MATFRNELKHIAKNHDMSLVDIAKKLKLAPARLSVLGSKKGISYNELNKIIDVINPYSNEKIRLRNLAKFARPHKGIIINDDFIDAIFHELMMNDASWDDCKQLCKAVLKFAGVKTKIK